MFIAGYFRSNRRQMLVDFPAIGSHALLMVPQQMHPFGSRLVPLTDQVSIPVNIVNWHSRGTQTLEKFNPLDMLPGVNSVAIGAVAPTGTFINPARS